MFDGLSSAWSIVFASVQAAFGWQAAFWDAFGVLPTFLLVFVGATFFRYIVLRMFGAGSVGASDSVISARQNAGTYLQSTEGYFGGRYEHVSRFKRHG